MGRVFLHPTPDEMPRTADVIVIGGGPAAAAALWALERLQPNLRAVLVEKTERLGAGSSTASLECYRTCWPTPCIARQMARSVEVFHNADEWIGEGASTSIHLKEHGYLFCAFTESYADTLRADVRHLHSLGLTHIEYLDAAETRARFPFVGERIVGAKFDPVAGSLDSNALIHALANSARNAKILLGMGDVSLKIENGCVTGVDTAHGAISAPRVVLAAGAGAVEIGRRAGLHLPVVMRPRQSFTTGWRHEAIPASAPMIIGAPPSPHLRPEASSGAIFGYEYGWHNKHAPEANRDEAFHDALNAPVDNLNKLKDPRFPSLTLALLARQFGHKPGEGFNDPRYLRSIYHNIGYYVSRDENAAYRTEADGTRVPYESERAIIGPYPGVEGLTLSIAHSGHGIMSAPGGGEIAAYHALGLPLPDPTMHDFGIDVAWVAHDERVL